MEPCAALMTTGSCCPLEEDSGIFLDCCNAIPTTCLLGESCVVYHAQQYAAGYRSGFAAGEEAASTSNLLSAPSKSAGREAKNASTIASQFDVESFGSRHEVQCAILIVLLATLRKLFV